MKEETSRRNAERVILPSGDGSTLVSSFVKFRALFLQQGYLTLSSALEKNLKRVLWRPSVCMQQPCTTVLITRLTRTRLMALEEELNSPQNSSRRSRDTYEDVHKQKTKTNTTLDSIEISFHSTSSHRESIC